MVEEGVSCNFKDYGGYDVCLLKVNGRGKINCDGKSCILQKILKEKK